jgi:flagellar motility protein MotE (MotC chaperone)
MLKKLNSPWIGSIVGLVAFLAVTGATWNAATRDMARAQNAAAAAPIANAAETLVVGDNVEVEALIKELREERDMLSKRERDLNELQARLAAERNELTQLTQAVHNMQKEFDASVSRVTEEEPVNLKRLAKTYGSMDAEGAAKIFKQMDDGSIVKIMLYMKEQETGPVLSALSRLGEIDAKRAGDLTEKLRLAVLPKKK